MQITKDDEVVKSTIPALSASEPDSESRSKSSPGQLPIPMPIATPRDKIVFDFHEVIKDASDTINIL